MQDGLTKNWKKTLRRVDTFGDYTVSGFQYESEEGETGWHITAWAIHRPVHDYWVSGKDFYTMRIHYFHNFTNRHLIELLGTITDLEESEQKPCSRPSGSGRTQCFQVPKWKNSRKCWSNIGNNTNLFICC